MRRPRPTCAAAAVAAAACCNHSAICDVPHCAPARNDFEMHRGSTMEAEGRTTVYLGNLDLVQTNRRLLYEIAIQVSNRLR